MANGTLNSTEENGRLSPPDVAIIIVYFVGILCIGLWASFRSTRSTLKGYFLAGSKMNWWPVGASLFASNIGSEHFIGLAGYGAANGLVVAAYELNGMFIFPLLGWYFLPVYLSAKVFTMPEYLRKRFGGQRIRVYLAVLSLILSLLTKISVAIFTGALFVQQALGWNLYLSVTILLFITAIYTVMGGLSAVMYTDAAQTVIMLGGAVVLMILSFQRVSWDDLQWMYPEAIPSDTLMYSNLSCGYPREDAFHLFRHPVSSDLPWPCVIFGITVSAVWYVCTDQVMVQRALASKTVAHAKGGCILAGFLKALPLFLIVIPGMISRVLFTDAVACVSPEECMEYCGSEIGCSNIAYPQLVVNIMPKGLKGLMLAVVMSGLMSSLTSIFNSSSTIFTIDIWTRLRPNAKETELMVVGRVFVLLMVVIGILWIGIIQSAQGGRLFDYIQSITSYLAPPICAVFVLAVSWGRTNEKGAFWGLMLGLVIGITRMVLDFSFVPPGCGEVDTRPGIIAKWHYLYFGLFLFGVVCVFTVIVSLMTQPLSEKYTKGLTFWTRKEKIASEVGTEMTSIEVQSITTDQEDTSCIMKLMDIFCGTGRSRQTTTPTENELAALENLSSLKESRFERIILSVFLVMLLGFSVALWVLFA